MNDIRLIDIDMVKRIMCALELAEYYASRQTSRFSVTDIRYIKRLQKDIAATFPTEQAEQVDDSTDE